MRILCIWFAKLLYVFCRLIGHNGTNAAGKVIVRVYPHILTDLSKQVKEKIIVVCGTNGKTTTNNMIYKILTDSGKTVVCNRLGANMIEGVIVAFLNNCTLTGKLKADFACLEIDEGYAVKVFKYMKPHFVILTNLFRDQLDRYGEIDITTKMLHSAFQELSSSTLILNADDPLGVQFAHKESLNKIYYGISQKLNTEENEIKEGRTCPLCGEALDYTQLYYCQLGHFSCPKCEFTRPAPHYAASGISFDNGLDFDINGTHIHLNSRGLYNIYNVLAAFAVTSESSIDKNTIGDILKTYQTQIGRMEEFEFKNKKVVINLSKNPAGFNQGISTVLLDSTPKDILIAVNSNLGDGTDVSWLWDVDFEKLDREDTMHITTCGTRCYDMYLRLKYSDFKNISVDTDIKNAISELLKTDSKIVYLLVNYTTLFTTQKIVKELWREENNGN